MKKVLLITSYFPPRKGGISNFLFNIYKSNEDDCIVFTDLPDSNPKKNVIRDKFYSKKIWPRWLPLLYKTYKQIKKNNIQILQAGQIIPIGTVCYLLNKLIGIKYQVYVYGNDLLISRDSIRKTKIIGKILKNADKVIACSEYTKKLAIKNGAVEDKTLVVYPITMNLDVQQLTDEEITHFKNNNNLDNKRIILTVGNLVERKGQDMVIKSLAQMKQQLDDFIYIIIGSGPYKEELNRLINKFKLNEKVKIIENVSNDELPYYYSSCDLFIMPSRYLRNKKNQPIDVEGFGIVFIEASLYEKPVIAGNTGGQMDAVMDHQSGYIVDAEDVNSISDKIELLLSDTELSKSIGKNGRIFVKNHFNWENEVNKIRQIIG
ncbi:MAG: glycosyltransferase family 4 protein [bacterium]|nr:glycosyltransferase family 4 protein [bacterium]